MSLGAGGHSFRNARRHEPESRNDPLVAFALALRRQRLVREVTQERLADLAGLHPNHISDIERGRKDPRLTTVLRIADALGISPGELLRDVEPASTPHGARWRGDA